MDLRVLVPVCSLAIQVTSIFLAVRLWRRIESRAVTGALVLVVSLMAFRRVVALARTAAGEMQVDLVDETAGFLISCLVLFTVMYIHRLALSEQSSREALVSAEARYHTLFNQSPDGVLLIDNRGSIVDFNDETCRQLGYTREEFGKLHIADIDPFENPEQVRSSLERVAKEGKAEFDVKHRTKNGEIRDVHVITQTIRLSGELFYHTIWRDVTEQKKAEEALYESEYRLRLFIEHAPAALAMFDREMRYLAASRRWITDHGLANRDIIGRSHYQVFPELPERWKTACRRGLAGNVVSADAEEFVRADGSRQWLKWELLPWFGAEGRVGGIVIFTEDITARRKAEEKIRQSEQFIRGILDTVDEGFIVVDREYRIVTANKAYYEQTGRSHSEIIGKRCHEISHGKPHPCFSEGEDCAPRRVFETGKPSSSIHKHIDAGGAVLYVETKAFPIRDASGQVVSVIETISNITEKHLLEEERLKTQKLESIGTLAGGIAHDFNNLLQGIFGYISMAKMTLDEREKARTMLEQAEKALHQSVNLTTQLLTFSKGGKPVKKTLALAPVIENAVKFALSGSRSTYDLHIQPGLWQVEADEGQFAQVVHNIVLNAEQSMPLGGRVLISARNVSASEGSLPAELSGRDAVAVSIEDSGVGISEQYLDKIFDPYFTTKEKGSGLGLATSYSIVKNHGGVIRVKSGVDAGSTFFLYLPASENGASSGIPRESRAGRRKARVLIMDDEQVIRTVAAEMLSVLGHEPVFADRGETAIEAYRAAREANRPFDAVILDLTIRGGMGGAETLRELLGIDPGVKAIVSSGYSDNAISAGYREQGFRAFLKKPYNVDELQEALVAVLGEGDSKSQ